MLQLILIKLSLLLTNNSFPMHFKPSNLLGFFLCKIEVNSISIKSQEANYYLNIKNIINYNSVLIIDIQLFSIILIFPSNNGKCTV